jgi:hypothetical protein
VSVAHRVDQKLMRLGRVSVATASDCESEKLHGVETNRETCLVVVVFDVHSRLIPDVCLFTMLSGEDSSCPTCCSVTLIAIFRLEH